MAGSTRWLEYFISLEGLIKILEFVSLLVMFYMMIDAAIGIVLIASL
jgi:hypothetical protein